jgi:hypothetical protein
MPEPLFTALCYQVPVHEIVRGVFVILGQRPAVIRQYLVSKVETKHSGNRYAALAYAEKPDRFRELTSEAGEQFTREDRSPKSMNTLRVNFVEFLIREAYRVSRGNP